MNTADCIKKIPFQISSFNAWLKAMGFEEGEAIFVQLFNLDVAHQYICTREVDRVIELLEQLVASGKPFDRVLVALNGFDTSKIVPTSYEETNWQTLESGKGMSRSKVKTLRALYMSLDRPTRKDADGKPVEQHPHPRAEELHPLHEAFMSFEMEVLWPALGISSDGKSIPASPLVIARSPRGVHGYLLVDFLTATDEALDLYDRFNNAFAKRYQSAATVDKKSKPDICVPVYGTQRIKELGSFPFELMRNSAQMYSFEYQDNTRRLSLDELRKVVELLEAQTGGRAKEGPPKKHKYSSVRLEDDNLAVANNLDNIEVLEKLGYANGGRNVGCPGCYDHHVSRDGYETGGYNGSGFGSLFKKWGVQLWSCFLCVTGHRNTPPVVGRASKSGDAWIYTNIDLVIQAHYNETGELWHAGQAAEYLLPLFGIEAKPQVRGLNPSTTIRSPEARTAKHYDLNDRGNAQRLVDAHKDSLRFVGTDSKGQWRAWTGKVWSDDANAAMRKAGHVLDLMKLGDNATREHALKSGKYANMRGMVSIASTMEEVATTESDFDKSRMKFNVLNGTIDLETCSLKEHNPADMITKMAEVVFDPTAECPEWKKFVSDVFLNDQEVVEYFQKYVGYMLTGSCAEQTVHFWIGSGANGKGTIVRVLDQLMGQYNVTMNNKLLDANHQGHDTEKMTLKGAHAAFTGEADIRGELAVNLLKSLSGEDRIGGRKLFKDESTFEMRAKLNILCNDYPTIPGGGDDAFWRRARVLYFGAKFESSKILSLSEKILEKEASGILAWAVEGLQKYHQEVRTKGTGLELPASAVAWVDHFKKAVDNLTPFMLDHCVVTGNPKDEVRTSDLYRVYVAWAKSINKKTMSLSTFGKNLTKKGIEAKKSSEMLRVGIRLIGSTPKLELGNPAAQVVKQLEEEKREEVTEALIAEQLATVKEEPKAAAPPSRLPPPPRKLNGAAKKEAAVEVAREEPSKDAIPAAEATNNLFSNFAGGAKMLAEMFGKK